MAPPDDATLCVNVDPESESVPEDSMKKIPPF